MASETLMNHTNIVDSIEPHSKRAQNLAYLNHPYIIGEMNSIAKQGRSGESNVFGDALWLVDFSLWAAEHVRFLSPIRFQLVYNPLTLSTGHYPSEFPPRHELPLCLVAAHSEQGNPSHHQTAILRPDHGSHCSRTIRENAHQQHSPPRRHRSRICPL